MNSSATARSLDPECCVTVASDTDLSASDFGADPDVGTVRLKRDFCRTESRELIV
jgi:hypothetical protein